MYNIEIERALFNNGLHVIPVIIQIPPLPIGSSFLNID